MNANAKPSIVIVGAGAGGLTAASLLLKQRPDLNISVVDPADAHYYQPAWTLVGGGSFRVEDTRRAMADVMPRGVRWIKASVRSFEPEQNRVQLDNGQALSYQFLLVAAGLQLDWNKIEGLADTLGNNGVTSNYRYDLAPYTWECIRGFKGGNALFTQPAMPIKCAGAPQKILYLAADRFRRAGVSAALSFYTPGPSMFGVPFYSKALDVVVAEYGIQPRFGHTLVAVDGARRVATFDKRSGDVVERIETPFTMLHVVPPQSAPDFIKSSPLAHASGWVDVDKFSLQHVKYPNVFGLGDCTTTPNSKTAAAVRSQAPVVVRNLLNAIDGRGEPARYDGYASCPLTTSVGKIMLAEFTYDGVVAPSFPLDPRIPRRAYWWLKKSYLPGLYWGMLQGRMGLDWHAPRSFPEAVPAFVA